MLHVCYKCFRVLNQQHVYIYDSKNEHYRTTEINEVIGYTAQLSKELEQIKKPDFSNFKEKSGLVPSAGVEPAQFPTGV